MADNKGLLSKVQSKLVNSLQGFGYDQNLLEVASNFIKASPDAQSDEAIKKMMERTYKTQLKKGTMKPWKIGDLEKGRHVPIRIQERIDMMRLAANQPQMFNSLKESEYRPTTGNVKEDDIFYSFVDKNQMGEFYKHLKKYLPKMEKGKTYQMAYDDEGENINLAGKLLGLGQFQVSLGEDEKGTYAGIYDEWDIDKKWVPNWLEDTIFPSFNFYDRIYYDRTNIIDEMFGRSREDLKLRDSGYTFGKQPLKEVESKAETENRIIEFMKGLF